MAKGGATITISDIDAALCDFYENATCMLEKVSETSPEELLDQFHAYHYRVSLLSEIILKLEPFKRKDEK